MGQYCVRYMSNISEDGSVIECTPSTQTIVCYHSTPWYKRLFKRKKGLGKYDYNNVGDNSVKYDNTGYDNTGYDMEDNIEYCVSNVNRYDLDINTIPYNDPYKDV